MKTIYFFLIALATLLLSCTPESKPCEIFQTGTLEIHNGTLDSLYVQIEWTDSISKIMMARDTYIIWNNVPVGELTIIVEKGISHLFLKPCNRIVYMAR